MTEMKQNSSSEPSIPNKGARLAASLLILVIASALLWLIFSTQPKAVRVGATKKTAMLVEVTKVDKGDFRPVVEVMGTVKPSKDIVLRPRVSGEILSISKSFVPGGFVKKGDILLQIDSSDYQTVLERAKAALRQAQAELDIEMGQQEAARKSYQLMNETLPEDKEALVLRKPQLETLKAKVESARATVEQAQRDLWRTTVRAPFDAHILSREVNVGSQVSSTNTLGRLVGWRTYWVETSVPLATLQWLDIPNETGEEGAEVLLHNRSAWPENVYRKGKLFKLIGSLDEQSRLARVLVEVEDPLAHHKENKDQPALMIGSFVDARIQAKEIKDVVRIDLNFLRKNDTVWVMKDNTLDIRDVDVMFRDRVYAYIGKGLDVNDSIVTTNLATVAQGALLRLKENAVEKETDATNSISK